MTEEIIIDGVNVAGCTYFQQEDDEYTCGAEECNGAVVGCRACDNCYYKQLKRLEQERDKLKTELHSKVEFIQEQRTIINEYAKEIEIYKQCQGKRASKREEELKQENKELKKQIESDKGLITVGGKQQYQYLQRIDELEQENKTLQAYKDINEDFKQAWYELNEKYKQLRSALEEIREIAEKYKDMEGCRIPLGAIKTMVDEVLKPSN